MPENILYIILLASGASFVQRTIGFGFGIFIMTALPFLMPSYGEAVTLSGLLSLTSATVVMLKYIKFVTWKRMLPMVAAFVVFSSIAICLLDRIEGRAGLVIGILAGNWAYKRIPNRLFTYVVYAYIGLSGLIIFLTA